MARIAAATKCPHDTYSLVTCVGEDTDETLNGLCPACNGAVSMPNLHRVVDPPVDAATHQAALDRIAELEKPGTAEPAKATLGDG